MPSRSVTQRLRDLKGTLSGPERYLDLALIMVRAERPTETILNAGGRWDTVEQRFLPDDSDVERCCVIELAESQVPFTRWFAKELRDYRLGYPRDIRLALAAGDRRGGKTFDTFFCLLAALIDVPRMPDRTPAIGWAISRTFRERDEL